MARHCGRSERTVNKLVTAWSKAFKKSESNEQELEGVAFNAPQRGSSTKKQSIVPQTQLVFQLVLDFVRSKQLCEKDVLQEKY